ncbi:DUF6012 family protein [Halopseudomonas pachastrellae]|nr:DUF6012 family protein [Halopseudomonas pachastrellae]
MGADRVVNHQVQYFVLDDELDAITDAWCCGMACRPASAVSPALANNCRELDTGRRAAAHGAGQPRARWPLRRPPRLGRARLGARRGFQVHTVERERVLFNSKSDIYDRIPTADMAFRASV